MIAVWLVLYEMENDEHDQWSGVEGVYLSEERAHQAQVEAEAEPEAPNVTYAAYWIEEMEAVE